MEGIHPYLEELQYIIVKIGVLKHMYRSHLLDLEEHGFLQYTS